MRVPDQVVLETQAPRDNDFAVLGERFTDRAERLLDCRVDEAAGIDDDEIRAGVVGCSDVTLGPELGEDPFGIYERFGTAERYKPDFRAFYRNRLAVGIPGIENR